MVAQVRQAKREFLSPVEASRILGVGLERVYKLLWAGKLLGRKVDGHWKVDATAVEQRRKRLSQSETQER